MENQSRQYAAICHTTIAKLVPAYERAVERAAETGDWWLAQFQANAILDEARQLMNHYNIDHAEPPADIPAIGHALFGLARGLCGDSSNESFEAAARGVYYACLWAFQDANNRCEAA